jgi:hypothetical protein
MSINLIYITVRVLSRLWNTSRYQVDPVILKNPFCHVGKSVDFAGFNNRQTTQHHFQSSKQEMQHKFILFKARTSSSWISRRS